MSKSDLTIAQETILKALQDRESLRVHAVYYPDVFSLSCRGLITFNDLREEHWRGFEVRARDADDNLPRV